MLSVLIYMILRSARKPVGPCFRPGFALSVLQTPPKSGINRGFGSVLFVGRSVLPRLYFAPTVRSAHGRLVVVTTDSRPRAITPGVKIGRFAQGRNARYKIDEIKDKCQFIVWVKSMFVHQRPRSQFQRSCDTSNERS